LKDLFLTQEAKGRTHSRIGCWNTSCY